MLCNLEKIKLTDININNNNIYKVCSNINYNFYDDYTDAILKNNIKSACEVIKSIYDEGYSIMDIFYFYFIFLKTTKKIPEIKKLIIIKVLCKYIGLINNNYEDNIELVIFTKNIITELNKNT